MFLGCPYFKSREQFLAIYASRRHQSTDEVAVQKAALGLRVEGLSSMFVTEKNSYQFVQAFEWDLKRIVLAKSCQESVFD